MPGLRQSLRSSRPTLSEETDCLAVSLHGVTSWMNTCTKCLRWSNRIAHEWIPVSTAPSRCRGSDKGYRLLLLRTASACWRRKDPTRASQPGHDSRCPAVLHCRPGRCGETGGAVANHNLAADGRLRRAVTPSEEFLGMKRLRIG